MADPVILAANLDWHTPLLRSPTKEILKLFAWRDELVEQNLITIQEPFAKDCLPHFKNNYQANGHFINTTLPLARKVLTLGITNANWTVFGYPGGLGLARQQFYGANDPCPPFSTTIHSYRTTYEITTILDLHADRVRWQNQFLDLCTDHEFDQLTVASDGMDLVFLFPFNPADIKKFSWLKNLTFGLCSKPASNDWQIDTSSLAEHLEGFTTSEAPSSALQSIVSKLGLISATTHHRHVASFSLNDHQIEMCETIFIDQNKAVFEGLIGFLPEMKSEEPVLLKTMGGASSFFNKFEESIVLECQDFQDVFRVYSSDQVEAFRLFPLSQQKTLTDLTKGSGRTFHIFFTSEGTLVIADARPFGFGISLPRTYQHIEFLIQVARAALRT